MTKRELFAECLRLLYQESQLSKVKPEDMCPISRETVLEYLNKYIPDESIDKYPPKDYIDDFEAWLESDYLS